MIIFPDIPGIAFNSKKTQRWDVKVQKSGSKKRKTMTSQVYPEWDIEVKFVGLTKEYADKIMGFYGAIKGPLTPFLWKDLEDYKEINVRLGIGTGSSQNLYLIRNIGGYLAEPVCDVVPNTLKIYAAGIPIDYNLGADGFVNLTAPNGTIITASFEYYWRVAFADEYIENVNIFYDLHECSKLRLVSVR